MILESALLKLDLKKHARSEVDTHTLFYIREDKIDESLQKDAIPSLEISKFRTINDILLGQKAMINTLTAI